MTSSQKITAYSRPALVAIALLGFATPAWADTPDYSSLAAELMALRTKLDALVEENASLRRQFGIDETAPAPATSAAAPARLQLIGDLRLRYDDLRADHAAFARRHDYGLRLRAGALAAFSNQLEMGVRLTNGVGDGDSPGRLSSKKSVALDLAFLRWTPRSDDTTTLAFLAGKMEFPLVASDLVFHGDITPEGAAVQHQHRLGDRHLLRANAGVFLLDQPAGGARDPYLGAAQFRVDSQWSRNLTSTVGLTALAISHASSLSNGAVPDGARGNTRTADGSLVNEYHPWALDVGLVLPFHGMPVRLAGTYMINPGADDANHAYDAGIALGQASRKGSWEVGYRYRVLQADAWYEELVHPDFGGFYTTAPAGGSAGYQGGTNVGGHVFGGSYALSDHATVGFTYFVMHLLRPVPAGSPSDTRRLQIDTNLRF